jgi:hypothetical protein
LGRLQGTACAPSCPRGAAMSSVRLTSRLGFRTPWVCQREGYATVIFWGLRLRAIIHESRGTVWNYLVFSLSAFMIVSSSS